MGWAWPALNHPKSTTNSKRLFWMQVQAKNQLHNWLNFHGSLKTWLRNQRRQFLDKWYWSRTTSQQLCLVFHRSPIYFRQLGTRRTCKFEASKRLSKATHLLFYVIQQDNDFKGTEDCVEVKKNKGSIFEWDDKRCSEMNYFVCQLFNF